MRLAICFDRFGPYHVARINSAASHGTVLGLEYHAETSEYAWEQVAHCSLFERVTLFGGVRNRKPGVTFLREAITRALDHFQPDAVAIPGWSSREAFATLLWCLSRNRPAILMSETQADDETRHWWKEGIKRRLAGLFSSALVGGASHADYLVELGMARGCVFPGYDVVDNGYFESRADACRETADQWRLRLRLPGNYFLASARFIAKKNLARLLSAYAGYVEVARESAWHLVLLGDGPLRGELEQLCSQLQITDRVHLPGFIQYDRLPAYYGLSRAFVHASTTEQWGLVVNEAMAAGLPVLVSNRCGCAGELVRESENGFTFDPMDTNALARQLAEVASREQDLSAMGKASREIIARYSSNAFAGGLSQAAKVALSARSPAPSGFDKALLWALMRQ